MRAASESARTLVAPLARTAAKMWLTKSGFDDMAYLDKSEFQVWFLKAYMALGEDWSVPDDISNFIWAWNGSFYDMSSVDILPLAEWAQLEKTTHWYTGVGWILWEASEVDSALEMLEKAIELVSLLCMAPFEALPSIHITTVLPESSNLRTLQVPSKA